MALEFELVSEDMSLVEMVESNTPGDARLLMCIQCGTCGGSCPSGPDMDHTPRQIFAMLRAGLKNETLQKQYPLVLRVLLPMYSSLPAGNPHHGLDVHVEADVD